MEIASKAAQRYSRGAMALHWIIAILIALNFSAAWAAEDAPKAEKMQIMANHKAIGLTILALSVLRLVWRLTHRPLPLLESLKTWEAALAKVVHWLFYLALVAIPLAGWAMHSAALGQPVSFFGLFDIPALPLAKDKATAGIFHDLHGTLATLMLVLIGLHLAAVAKHLVIDRDGTFRRMVPWGK
jgi:cytochrome b561